MNPQTALTKPIAPPAVTTQRSALAVMAARFNVEPAKLLDTLKATAFKNATDAQMMTLCIVANEFGLNPFLKQIYAFPDKGGGIVPVVGVDGWIKIMNDHPQFDGIEFEVADDGEGKIHSCTASIYRKDRTRAVVVTEYFGECHRNTDPWRTSPRRMLRHKALIQGVRVAFGFSGIYDEEEAELHAMRSITGIEIPVGKVGASAPAPAAEPVKTIMEQAAEEAAAPAPEPEPAPSAPKGEPCAAELLETLLAKAPPTKIKRALVSLGLMEPSDALEKLPAKTLANILDGWDSIAEAIAELK